MAQPQLLQIKLSRFDAQPWGFRLQGGVDFAQPLLVQKVNAGSLSEQAGMQPGDAVIKINDVDVFNLRHKDAQDIVVRSGNNFVITVQRGGSTWRPHVTPTGNIPQANSPYLQTVTKTSLAHHQPDSQHIGCGYNNSARPFDNGGSDSGVKSIVNKQYNTPVGIYSDESIAETLSAQAEVLAGGVLGVNFKKNEKEYQGDRSEVLKFLREEETGQSTPAFNNNSYEHDAPQQQHLQQHHHQQQRHQQHQHLSQQQQSNTNSATRHVSAPINTPKLPSTGGLPTGQNICTECERLITGVFVRIKDKNLHVECFKCATCGTSLKNQGYYNFNNKLYCDIHAKQAAQQHPPAGTEGYVPVPIKPNTKLSATTISSALSSHGYGSNGYNGSNGNSSSPSAPVNQGYARPYGASQPPAAAPKSPVPVSYPPPQQQQQSPYPTLPRSNVGQQVLSSCPPLAKPNNLHANQNITMPQQQKSTDTSSQKLNDDTGVNKDMDASALLAQSIGNINKGDQTNAFLHEAGKIISNMLEARLKGGSDPLSHSRSTLSVCSINNPNLCKSPMIGRKHLDLGDYKDIDPKQPVEPTSHQKWAMPELGNQVEAEPQVGQMDKIFPAQHPTAKILDMLDSPKTTTTTPSQQTPEPVTFRTNLQVSGAIHVADRRSNIEPMPISLRKNNKHETEKNNHNNCQLNAKNFSVCGRSLGYAMGPMSKENEKVVSRLLEDAKRPVCCHCKKEIISGPFITALGRIWCPDHFICVNGNCRRALQDIGFVEEKGDLYCEYCFEKFLAPSCSKCGGKIKGDCLNAIGKHFHPECFTCGQCGKIFGNMPFFLEDGNAYCEADWNELFTTKCFACGFPVEAGDRWVEALNHNYHSQCFNCTFCKQNLEGQSFYNKGGRPFCKNHAR